MFGRSKEEENTLILISNQISCSKQSCQTLKSQLSFDILTHSAHMQVNKPVSCTHCTVSIRRMIIQRIIIRVLSVTGKVCVPVSTFALCFVFCPNWQS